MMRLKGKQKDYFLFELNRFTRESIKTCGLVFMKTIKSESIDELSQYLLTQMNIDESSRNHKDIIRNAYMLEIQYSISADDKIFR